jgi:predicted esterase
LVTKDSLPFLLIHGEADKVVTIHNSELMEEQLRQAGVPLRRGTVLISRFLELTELCLSI